jgi:signal transduction histidine kinase
VNPAVPAPLSAIILHLLEKEPDHRYQSADGLVYDLERARRVQSGPAAAVGVGVGVGVGGRDFPVRLVPEVLALRSAVPVELKVAVEQRLPEQVEIAAYYVVSEALTNAAKHAAASLVQVRADIVEAEGADLLRVEVRDDGRGGAKAQGTGLLGLKDRAEALGGRIFLDSPPGAGTTLRLELPLSTVGLGKFR